MNGVRKIHLFAAVIISCIIYASMADTFMPRNRYLLNQYSTQIYHKKGAASVENILDNTLDSKKVGI